MTLAPDDPRHGTVTGYVNLRCRCEPCRTARSAYDARRRTSIQRRIAASTVRRHVAQLLADGATATSIARAAGCGHATIYAIANGTTRWVQATTADRVLAVSIDQCRTRATHSSDWRRHAACASPDQPVDLWFPTKKSMGRKGGDDPDYTATVKAAKSVCGRCPVADDCLRYAIAERIDHGIWGGFTTAERAEVAGAA